MRAEIITIGDELLIGQVVDTNSAFVAQMLNEEGISLYQITSVHDDQEHIVQAVTDAFRHADIVFTTGGLGPTKDDITKRVMCEYFATRLITDEKVHAHILDLYKERPDVLNRLTATQWLVPESAVILENRVGSAPLMVFHHEGKMLCCMPGVPYEMEIAMREQIMPYIHSELTKHGFPTNRIIHRTVQVTGIPESSLAILLEDWERSLPQSMHLAYLPKDGMIRLRLSSYGDATPEEVEAEAAKVAALVSDNLVTTEDKPLEILVGERLKALGMTIATAESCTGGKLASLLNKHSGASAFYYGSVVAYDNSVKQHVLGVSEDNLRNHGAVSEQVVREMAEGVRRLLKTDCAIATSGVAGPDGGTKEKPVGTVWIAWATPKGTEAECFYLGRLREQVTDRACVKALVRLLRVLD